MTDRNPLLDFDDRWKLDADCVLCRDCHRSQQVSWAQHDFQHSGYCRNTNGERNPWKSLAGLITSQIARAKEPA